MTDEAKKLLKKLMSSYCQRIKRGWDSETAKLFFSKNELETSDPAIEELFENGYISKVCTDINGEECVLYYELHLIGDIFLRTRNRFRKKRGL